ncbi:MAG: hypothetical protein K4571_04770 [Deltaproteobacteria bacterium]
MSDKIGEILVSKNIISALDLSEAMERKKSKPSKYLGQILCEMGLPQSKIIKGIYFSNKRKQLGQVYVDLNIITPGQLSDHLSEQKLLQNRGIRKSLGALLARNRAISEMNHLEALSAHFSMPIVSLKGYRISPLLQKAIGEKFALMKRMVVLSDSPLKVTVALAEPNLFIFDNLEKAMPRGKQIVFCLARASEIEDCLDASYDPFHFTGSKS